MLILLGSLSAVVVVAADVLMPLEEQLTGARERLEANLRSGIDEVLQSVAKAEARLEKERARLEAERTSLEREKAAFAKDKLAERTRAEAEAARVAATQRGLSSKVKLDVGGVHYATTRSHLTRVPGSLLEGMFSGRHSLKAPDEDGRYFIDRDGPAFRCVLDCPAALRLHCKPVAR